MKHNDKVGDSNQITREYFDSLLIETRYIDSVIPSTTLELYGQIFSTPIMTAALSHLNGCHPDGMKVMAEGVVDANAVMWADMDDENEREAITSTGAKTIKIIKHYADNNLIYKKIEHAEKCGALPWHLELLLFQSAANL